MSTDIIHSFGLEVWHVYAVIVFLGILQGIINTVAGSGTVLMYSFLSALGMPVNVINGTVRLGIIFQTATSSYKFYKNKKLVLKKGLILGIPMIIGSVIGAELAVSINIEVFKKIVALVLLFMLFLMFYNPQKWIDGQSKERQAKTGIWQLLIFLAIGFYGGFIHIGVGIFLLSALVLNAGFDLVNANGLKVFLVLMYAPFVFTVYLISGQIDLWVALFAAVGNVIGSLIGSGLAIKRGAGFIRSFLVVIILAFSLHLLGVWKFLFGLF